MNFKMPSFWPSSWTPSPQVPADEAPRSLSSSASGSSSASSSSASSSASSSSASSSSASSGANSSHTITKLEPSVNKSHQRLFNECGGSETAARDLLLRTIKTDNVTVDDSNKIALLPTQDQYPHVTAMIKEIVNIIIINRDDYAFRELAFLLDEPSLYSELLRHSECGTNKTQIEFFHKFFSKWGTDLALAKLFRLISIESELLKYGVMPFLNRYQQDKIEKLLSSPDLETINGESTESESAYTNHHALIYGIVKDLPFDGYISFYNKLGFSYNFVVRTLKEYSNNYLDASFQLLTLFLNNGEGNNNNNHIIDAMLYSDSGGYIKRFKDFLLMENSFTYINIKKKYKIHP